MNPSSRGSRIPVDKGAGTEVLSGSIIVAGRGTARVVRVGAESFSSKLAADVRKRFSLASFETARRRDRSGAGGPLRY